MNADENGPAEFSFEKLLDEAVGPFFVPLDDETGIVVEIPVDAPSSEDVADLDITVSVHDQLDLLVDEDTADVIRDHYARRPISELAELVDDIRAHFGILIPPDQGWAYLVREIDRYGGAIEKDLWLKGDDLYDWVRDHLNLPWNKLLRLRPAFPVGGWYHAAIADDDERAEQILKLEADGELSAPSDRPSLIGWTPEMERLTAVADATRRIEHGVWGASPKFKGKGGKPPKPLPRPLTARERVEEQQAFAEHDDIAAQLLGDRYTRRYSDTGR